jgi:hypothetical protein
MKDEKKETTKDILLRVKTNLETIFKEVNATSEKATMAIIQCLKDLEIATQGGISLKEENIKPSSAKFANKHKEFCMQVGEMFDERDLHYFIHLSDPTGMQTISYGHMEDSNLMKALTGALIQSPMMFQGVMKELGLPKHCIECMENIPDEMTEGYGFGPGDIPQKLVDMLEKRFGGKMIPIAGMKVSLKSNRDREEEDDEPST